MAGSTAGYHSTSLTIHYLKLYLKPTEMGNLYRLCIISFIQGITFIGSCKDEGFQSLKAGKISLFDALLHHLLKSQMTHIAVQSTIYIDI